MSSSVNTITATPTASGSLSPGALIPFTHTFVQSSGATAITTPIALVGQVLDNGMTNFVGYDSGSAIYIVSSGANDAMPTTLANGMTYYFSERAAPGGYLLTSGGSGGQATRTGSGNGWWRVRVVLGRRGCRRRDEEHVE
ncbi:hypothetical protein TI39_contig258g00003 [Zymoseptoria brevis]|uniref:Uncharacterized protein n=1 Tax=Zymoseptoria brevis TaxID=1047168 RepID=A0A0F4GXH1_9PEZI|nr:hypothetical protein TI39_contig258g00003 [Zymoseptoria brevis]